MFKFKFVNLLVNMEMCSLLSCHVFFKRSLLVDKIVDVIVYFIMFFFEKKKKQADAVNVQYQNTLGIFGQNLSYRQIEAALWAARLDDIRSRLTKDGR